MDISSVIWGLILWPIATIITGYFLGVGIWAARPKKEEPAKNASAPNPIPAPVFAGADYPQKCPSCGSFNAVGASQCFYCGQAPC